MCLPPLPHLALRRLRLEPCQPTQEPQCPHAPPHEAPTREGRAAAPAAAGAPRPGAQGTGGGGRGSGKSPRPPGLRRRGRAQSRHGGLFDAGHGGGHGGGHDGGHDGGHEVIRRVGVRMRREVVVVDEVEAKVEGDKGDGA